jgi:glycosyltransferase involved in cell wall biosynthesis
LFLTKKDNHLKILIYTDAVVYGGHEVTLLEAVKGLLQEPQFDVCFMVPKDNDRLLSKLSLLTGQLRVIKHSFSTAAGDVFRVLCRSAKVRKVKKRIQAENPDLVIVSQGAIALSACGLGAAYLAGIPVMSFLPMAHPVALVRGKNSLLVKLQELVYRYLYNLPDFFFTMCQTTKRQLEHLHGVDGEQIFVSYYGFEETQSVRPELTCLRTGDKKKKHIALVGRIEFYQKQHDFFVKQLAAYKSEISSLAVHIIGDGPDREKLNALVNKLGLGEIVTFEGWVEDMKSWYSILDAIVLPSRFEGFPLVMVEAMYHGVPVVASKVDGMEEVLPAQWLFPANDGKKMMHCLRYVFNMDQHEHIKRNQRVVFDEMTAESYRKGFKSAVLHCLTRKK